MSVFALTVNGHFYHKTIHKVIFSIHYVVLPYYNNKGASIHFPFEYMSTANALYFDSIT